MPGRTAEETFTLVQKYAADTLWGGYREMFLRDWQPRPSGAYGGDRKSFDVHMHLMEAYTTLYELTHAEIHRRKLLEVIDLLWNRMFHSAVVDGHRAVRAGLHAASRHHVQDGVGLGP